MPRVQQNGKLPIVLNLNDNNGPIKNSPLFIMVHFGADEGEERTRSCSSVKSSLTHNAPANDDRDAYMKCNLLPIALSPLSCFSCSQLHICLLLGLILFSCLSDSRYRFPILAIGMREDVFHAGNVSRLFDTLGNLFFQSSSRVMELEPCSRKIKTLSFDLMHG